MKKCVINRVPLTYDVNHKGEEGAQHISGVVLTRGEGGYLISGFILTRGEWAG